ncbi:hypothetical protein ASD67_09680 [Sphingopyxis sp. Root1497]|uniref:hypothetical protein n=1 Tax=Sphingopyxis sp. Root1497 TaxID=1736474 RepID=UPI00070190DD|nr:hypothetical protein [Sphingopyxis sp. Root1497]KQZ64708.1 hypothetical protein ASD67_09680 [Sphingopyxis sp. Root1497]
MHDSLTDLVRAELATPVDPRARMMAAAIAAQYPGSARAVLFYGSCLRETQLDGLMLDFYLIVSDYGDAYGRRWMAAANRLIPPNVFPFQHDGLIAKYAVLSEADFHRLNGSETRNVSVWARFAQPSRLVWAVDDTARDRAIAAVARAAPTLLAAAGAVDGEQPLDWWRRAFALTYSAELRAERTSRAQSVVDATPERYARFSAAAMAAIPANARAGGWMRRRAEGKALSIVRLAKASLTYAGGIDYLAWKINRHAGTKIEIKPWQRRWPLVAALTLVPRLMRSGAIR